VYEQECLNPGFEAALGAEWAEFKTATGTTARSTETAKYGAASLKLVMTDSAAPGNTCERRQTIVAAPAEVWSFGMQAYFPASLNTIIFFWVDWLDAGLGFVAHAGNAQITVTNTGFAFMSLLNKTAPALTAFVRIRLVLYANIANATGICYYDGVQAVKAASLPNVYSQGNSIKNSFDQRTTAKQAVVTPAVFRGKPGITFDGADDLFRSILGPYLVGSSGLVMGLVRLTSTPNVFQVLFSSSDVATTTSNCIVFVRADDASPYAVCVQQNAADGADDLRGDTVITALVPRVYAWRSTGAAYSIRIEGRQEVLSVVGGGANTGDWYGDTTLRDNTVIGGWLTTSFLHKLLGQVALLLVYEGDPGMGARMKQLERMIRQRGLRALR